MNALNGKVFGFQRAYIRYEKLSYGNRRFQRNMSKFNCSLINTIEKKVRALMRNRRRKKSTHTYTDAGPNARKSLETTKRPWKYEKCNSQILLDAFQKSLHIVKYRQHPTNTHEPVSYLRVENLCTSQTFVDFWSLFHSVASARVHGWIFISSLLLHALSPFRIQSTF